MTTTAAGAPAKAAALADEARGAAWVPGEPRWERVAVSPGILPDTWEVEAARNEGTLASVRMWGLLDARGRFLVGWRFYIGRSKRFRRPWEFKRWLLV